MKVSEEGSKNFKNYIGRLESHLISNPKIQKKVSREVLPRVNKLKNQGFFIESVILLNQVIELQVLELVKEYEWTISSALFLSKFDTKLSVSSSEQRLLAMTFGQLIKELDRYCDDKDLIKELEYINHKIRNVFVHKLIEPNKSLENMDVIAKNSLKKIIDCIKKVTSKSEEIFLEHSTRLKSLQKIIEEYPQVIDGFTPVKIKY